MTPRGLRERLHRYVPADFEDPVGLAWRILRSGSPEALFTVWTSFLGLLATPLDWALRPVEEEAYRRADHPRRPLIFVCGAPRSGTTFAAQTLIRNLPVAYLTNLTAVFPRSPVTACRLFRQELRNARLRTRSYYGKTLRMWGPNDALYVWDRWFGPDRTRVPTSLAESDRAAMRSFFGAVERHYGRPVLNKNNSLNLSAHLVASALDAAHFVCMVRDPLFLAQSLLRARETIHGDRHRPYGIPAPGTEGLEDPIEHVCRQALHHDRVARIQQDRLGADRFWIVDYDEFCRDPGALVERVAADVLEEPLAADARRPAPSEPSRSRKVPRGDFERLERTLDRLDTPRSAAG